MGNRIKSVMLIAIGAIGGVFAGLPLGQILGIFAGNLFDMLGLPSNGMNGVAISGLIGLLCGTILGGSFFFLAKTAFLTNDKPVWEILVLPTCG